MGLASSKSSSSEILDFALNIPGGEWKWTWTGYRFVVTPVISDPTVKKMHGPGGSELWGPYKKRYSKSLFGLEVFTAPETVDGVRILCQCRDITQYMKDNNGGEYLGKRESLLMGDNRPACWEDSKAIINPDGGSTYTVTIGHPAFYGYAINKGSTLGVSTGFRGLGGKKTLKGANKFKDNKTKKAVRQ